MALGILTIQITIPGCKSLKDKRSRLKPLLTRLHREFNISVSEIDHHDIWQSAVIACATISNNSKQSQRSLKSVVEWIEKFWPEVTIVEDHIEII